LGLKKDKKDSQDDSGESIVEQAVDSMEELKIDPLGLKVDGNKVIVWEKLTRKQTERVEKVNADLFLVTADLIAPMMRSAQRDCVKTSRGMKSRLFLARNLRRGFVIFYQVMDPNVPARTVLEELNKEKSYVKWRSEKGAAMFSSFVESAEKREAVDELICSKERREQIRQKEAEEKRRKEEAAAEEQRRKAEEEEEKKKAEAEKADADDNEEEEEEEEGGAMEIE
jgi:hypothetical protein